MRTVTTTLRDFMHQNTDATVVDLLTVTLVTATVYRWTNHSQDVTTGGFTWTSGGTGTAPIPSRGTIREAVGLEPSDLDLTLGCGSTAELGAGVKLQTAASNGVLDGAQVKLERAYLDSAGAVIGTITRFQGQTSEVIVGNTAVELKVKSDLEDLNVQLPKHLYRPLCLHAVFDAGCGVSRAAFTVTSGTVQAGSTTLVVNHVLGSAPSYYTGGSITFTSGALNGVTRTIVDSNTTYFTVEFPLPSAPSAGVTFSVYPGCDKQSSTCNTKFSNLPRRMGFDYIPTTEAVGIEPTAEYAPAGGPGNPKLTLYMNRSSASAQSSMYGKPIPIVFGTQRIGGMIILAGMYHQSLSGYPTIGAGLIEIGLCEGPIAEVLSVWLEKTKSTPGALSLTTFPGFGITAYSAATTYSAGQWVSSGGTNYVSLQNANLNKTPASNPIWWAARGAAATERAQSAWAYLTTNYPTLAQGYGGLAYVAASAGWGTTADTALKRATFEVKGLYAGANGTGSGLADDARPDTIVADLLVNAEYGLGWSSARVDQYDASSGTPLAFAQGVSGTQSTGLWRLAHAAQMAFSIAITEQRPAREIIEEIGIAANSQFIWSEGKLKCRPLETRDITNPFTAQTYGGTATVVPIYDLGASRAGADLLSTDGADAITVERAALKEHFNCFPVEWSCRTTSRTDVNGTVLSEPANAYNAQVEEGTPDPYDVALYGLRKAEVTRLRCIVSQEHARYISNALARQSIGARNRFRFELPWRFALLEPADVVTITDANLGVSRRALRILELEESDSGVFSVMAEEVPTVATVAAATYVLT